MDTEIDGTDWRAIYRRYFQLQRAWYIAGATEPVANQFLHRIIHGHQTECAILREIHSFRLEPPPSEFLREAFFLQSVLYPSDCERPGGRHPNDPLEDVYAAALSMLPHGFWVVSPQRAQLYRGQRDARWPTIPTLFRRNDIDSALNQLARTIPRIQACVPVASEEQAVAVAQHYAKELGVATWLLDMTYDPRVALFFASDGGVTGETGAVVCVVQNEWRELSADGTNRLGQLRVIDVPGILRIENQRASFLDTSHPELFDQYVAHTVWFKQVSGVRFEDPDTDFKVTIERIYPTEDRVKAALLSTPVATEGALSIAPAGDAREPLGSTTYFEIAQSWSRQKGIEIDPYLEDTLRIVCDVHARLQSQRDLFELPDRSLARLQDAVKLIMHAQCRREFILPEEALRSSLSRLPPGTREVFKGIIAECAHGREFSLTSPTQLRDELLVLDNDLGGLPGRRVALLAFQDPNAKRADENVRTLLDTPGWTIVDLRDVPALRLPLALAQTLGAPKLAMLLDVAVAAPIDASLLIRALNDSQDAVIWVDGTQSELPANRMVYVVAVGARSVEELPRSLQAIDFMKFVRTAI